jgi:3-phosphoshikimate 1-carboxyvinyltransferase
MRFITALLATKEGDWIIEGSPRMHERPIGPLVRGLQSLGADITFLEKSGYPPLRIRGKQMEGGTVSVDAAISSQFISALLMIAPILKDGMTIELTGNIQSGPYIDMTLALMKRCGIQTLKKGRTITVKSGAYQAANVTVEADWSSAAFFYALAALSEKSELLLQGLEPESIQGDAIISEWFEHLGVSTNFEAEGARIQKTFGRSAKVELDFTGHPDIFLPFVIACAGTGVSLTATGLENLSLKESDRVKGAIEGLKTLGFESNYRKGVFLFDGSAKRKPCSKLRMIEVRDDHRMAMSFALLATQFPDLELDDVHVVSKSFPDFFNHLYNLGFVLMD